MTTAGDATAYLRELLRGYGLEALLPWALDQVQRGQSDTEIVQSMRQTPEFQQRFPAIAAREKAGLPPISPAEYVAYEAQATQLMRSYGLPSGFYDQPEDFSNLLAADVSVDELNKRIQQGYDRVMTLPAEVRATFRDYYGANGDSAIAAYFLSPDRATPILIEQAAAAAVGGIGKRFGFDIGRGTAEDAAKMGVTEQSAQQNLGQLAQQRDLYRETVNDTTDLSADVEGVKAAFGLDAESVAKVRGRLESRQAQFQGGDAFQTTQQGAQGLGTANRR